jgi:hypothetical protein
MGISHLGGKDIVPLIIAAGLTLDYLMFLGGKYKTFETEAARSRITLPGYF